MFVRPWGWLAAAAALLVLTHPVPAAAQLAQFETADIRIVYIEGTESFLVPHAARTFLNSLRFQQMLFEFTPTDKPTVLLVDFSDFGQGAAGSVPRNNVRVQIAPMNYVFETLPANERLTMLANHELVHVATMDQAAGSDLMFRRLFSGKVHPIPDQPESIGYFYLTSPRVATPRWFVEGIAVFIETWMGAGLGRAQGGYDEMVFRAMVRDGSHFYDPLGLVSEGTKIDFQVEANSYLYGGRFMTWLAYHYGPDKLMEWVARRPTSKAYFAHQFRQVFGRSLESAWADWIAFEKTFQEQNLAAIRKYPVTEPTRLVSPRIGIGVAAAVRRRQQPDLRGHELPGPRRAPWLDLHDDGRGGSPGGHQGPADLPSGVARVGSRRQRAVLHQRQRRAPRSDALRSRHWKDDRCCRRICASAIWR